MSATNAKSETLHRRDGNNAVTEIIGNSVFGSVKLLSGRVDCQESSDNRPLKRLVLDFVMWSAWVGKQLPVRWSAE